MSEPGKPLIPYATMRDWLRENGIGEFRLTKLIANGIIKPRHLYPGARALYSREEIERDVLKQNGSAK